MIEVSHNVVKIRNQETEAFEAVPGLVLGYSGEAIEPVVRQLSYLKDSDEIKQLIFNVIHPIGSIIHTTKEENPSTYLGGEWQRIEDRFLLGAGSTYAIGSTGGEAKHVLTVNEMPSHNHSPLEVNEEGTDTNYKRCFMTALHTNSDSTGRSEVARGTSSGINAIVATNVEDLLAKNSITSSTGGGAAHNNMPPYKTVYIWERIA